jgi:hypothetical protein
VHTHNILGTGLLLAVLQWPVPAVRADSSSFHGYGVLAATSTSKVTAISEERPDEAIETPYSYGCEDPFGGYRTPVYQAEWITNGKGAWVELGTGHQCRGYQFWFAGLAAGGVFQPVWTQAITSDIEHRFWIQGTLALNQDYFTFSVDSDQEAAAFDDLTAHYAETGVESFASKSTVPLYSMKSLEYGKGFSLGWHEWTGTSVVADGSPMCAQVETATVVKAGENVTCPPATPEMTSTAWPYRGGAVGAPPPTASAACRDAEHAWRAKAVVGAYQSDAQAVQSWRENRDKDMRPLYRPLTGVAATTPQAVCYLRGEFSGFPAAPGTSTTYKQLIVLVSERTGSAELDAANLTAIWPFRPPLRSGAWDGISPSRQLLLRSRPAQAVP